MHFFKTDAVKHFIQARFAQAERGAALVEYALLVALIAVVSILALNTLGQEVDKSFDSVNSCLATPTAANCGPATTVTP